MLHARYVCEMSNDCVAARVRCTFSDVNALDNDCKGKRWQFRRDAREVGVNVKS